MNKKTIMAVPAGCICAVVGVLLAGILIGSFFDFRIGMALANKNMIGTYFATFSPILAYFLLPAGGACLYVGLSEKGDAYRWPARASLLFGWFMGLYYYDNCFGGNIRSMLGFIPGESPELLSFGVWLVEAVLFALAAWLVLRLLDASVPDRLIAAGAAFLASSIVADAAMQWLKQIGSRPRPKYLLTLDDPIQAFRNWWQMIPHLAGADDSFLSWPSGHMMIVGVLFAVPLLVDCMKKTDARARMIAFVAVCIFEVLCAYNRIHMTNHFLSDVCFGMLISCLLTTAICTALTRAVTSKQ